PDIGGDGDRAPTGGVDRGCDLRQLVFAPRCEGDRSARIGERAGRRRADPPTGARDDRDRAMQGWIRLLQIVGHLRTSFGWSLPGRIRVQPPASNESDQGYETSVLAPSSVTTS